MKTCSFNYYLLVFYLIISLIHSVNSTACNNFPKIFGGSSGHTWLFHIDVFNDYLALAGDTNDISFTGISSFSAYLALSSISTGGKYYWAKVFTSKSEYFAGV